jgi:hypothetical protein
VLWWVPAGLLDMARNVLCGVTDSTDVTDFQTAAISHTSWQQ